MAIIFMDGFDTYNGITTSGTLVGADSNWGFPGGTTGPATVTGRFGGQAAQANIFSSGYWNAYFTPTDRFVCGHSFYQATLSLALATINPYISFWSDATAMVGLKVNFDGSISACRLTSFTAGTILGTSATGVIKAATWHSIEFACTISDTVGTVQIIVDGVTVLSLTNQDTRNGTPTTINRVSMGGSNGGTNTPHRVDDLYVTDSLTLLGPMRIETLYANADTAQKQWTTGENFELGVNTTASTTAFATKGNIYNCNANVTLNSVTSYFGAVAQNVKLGIARLTSANPGTVAEILYESNTTSLSAVAGNYKFSVPNIAFTNGNVYSVYFTRTDGDGTAILSVAGPATAAPTTTDQAGTLTWNSAARVADNNIGVGDSLFFSTTNYVVTTLGLTAFSASNYSVIDPTLLTSSGFVSSNTVGNYDLYDFGNLSSTANSIAAVQVNALLSKDNIATRAAAVTVKSGSSTTDGANTYLASSFNISNRLLNTDPNTSAAWTTSGVNALQAGVKVTI